jgi:hypothetical protein
MKPLFTLVGRAGFEPATNGLKALCALIAQSGSPLRMERMGRTDGHVLPPLCQKLPTYPLGLSPQWREG